MDCMDREIYKARIVDPNVSDETIMEMMKEELADRFDEQGMIIPPTEEEMKDMEEISELVWKARPEMMKKYSREWGEEHLKICPVCKHLVEEQKKKVSKIRKFTRKDLIGAYKDIEKEREAERQRAERAAKWLQQKCESLTVYAVLPPAYIEQYRNDVPYLPNYRLCIIYSRPTFFNTWLEERLKEPELPGISIHEKGFWLELGKAEKFPKGTRYYCYTWEEY